MVGTCAFKVKIEAFESSNTRVMFIELAKNHLVNLSKTTKEWLVNKCEIPSPEVSGC